MRDIPSKENQVDIVQRIYLLYKPVGLEKSFDRFFEFRSLGAFLSLT